MHAMRVRSLDPARVLTAVLALALGLQIAWTLTGLLGGRTAAGPDTSASPSPGTDPLDAIRAARLFGVPTGPEPAAQPEAAPVSTQGLVLSGVLAETDPRAGRAIIGEAAGGGRVYAVGGTLPGGSRLAEVYPDRVILDRGGSLETLPLPRQAGGTATALPASGGTAPPPTPAGAGPSSEDISQVIRWQAVMRTDKPSGVRVYPGANAQLFSQLGLRPGDLVLAINDSPLADQANGEQFIRSLAGTPQARLTIERAGRTESLLVDLATLSNPLNANPINSTR
jgi:general secretion pathway protein C